MKIGFGKNVLAPCDCVVRGIYVNSETNQPGVMKPARASSIVFITEEGDNVLMAHVRDISVSEGEKVKAGQVVAKVGNNGYSRSPHIHIAAWNKEEQPLQIQFDQKTIGLEVRQSEWHGENV